ncbi:energy transducer TonB [Algivirga pacifica]|uniref:TonB C-terminal domain-containing protein n=1 Tax=Algivirga pacifica TaxID=1162670 RepID=A0ABP9DBH5_9BACT
MFVEVLGKLGLSGILAIFVLLIVGLIFLFRSLIRKAGSDILEQKKQAHDASDTLVKKYNSVDVSKYSSLLMLIGLSLSLLITLVAFEYPTYDEKSQEETAGALVMDEEETFEIPPTQQQPPPPPKITAPKIQEVKDEEEIKEDLDIQFFEEPEEDAVIEEFEPEEEEVEDEIFEIVEEEAQPAGGLGAFYKWVGKNMKYPAQARRMGVEGKVYVSFVVDKDGSLTDIKVVRGIGAGCDEEAVRVLKKAKKWSPGKQRGRAVKSRRVLPIAFKLG